MADAPSFYWPRQGDKAFAVHGSPGDPSLVAAFVLPSTGGYAVGFKDAADKVVEAAASDDRNPDLLFFPVAYLYRHSLELSLKDIVRMSARSGAISPSEGDLDKLLGGHDLLCLWRQTRAAIEAVWPDGEKSDTDAVEKIILEFHGLDKSGQAFRYPTDKSGRPHVGSAPKCVSLQNLKRTFDAMDRFLDAAFTGIDGCDPGLP